MTTWPASLLVLALAATAGAQRTVVWPPGYAGVEGNSAQAAPFSVSTQWTRPGARATTLIRGASLPFAPGTAITAVAFRRDGQDPATYTALDARCDVFLGPVHDALTPVAGPRTPWSVPPDRVAALQLSLPASGPTGGGPAAFSLRLPFSRPWLWPGGDLGLDVVFKATPTTHWYRDAVFTTPLQPATALPIAAGCTASLPYPPQAFVDRQLGVLGGRLECFVAGTPPLAGSPALLLLGPTAAPTALPALPAGCTLQVTPWVALPAAVTNTANRFGYAGLSLSIPNDPRLLAGRLPLQWIVTDPAAQSALPAVVSNGLEVTLGRPAATTPRYGRSFWGYGTYAAAFDYTGTLGPADYVPVLELTIQ